MRDYGQLILHGSTAQLEKLRQNEHKNGFDNVPILFLLKRLYEEVEELDEAYCNEGIEEIRLEAADVANFAHMVIFNCDRIIKDGQE